MDQKTPQPDPQDPQDTQDPKDIPVWRRINQRLTSSGQPSEAQLEKISALGVSHVINLALHDHEKALTDEAACVASLGMKYIHIPVIFDAPKEENFTAFCEAMAEIGDAPVHVHCIINARVSAFIYRWQRDVRGENEQEARARMETVWRPGGVWAKFIGDDASIPLAHRPPR